MAQVQDMTKDELRELLEKHGSVRQVAEHQKQAYTTVSDAYRRHELSPGRPEGSKPRASKQKGHLTRDHLLSAMKPPNNCAVKALLDSMDEDEQEILKEALSYKPRDFSASQIIDMLTVPPPKGPGYPESQLPTTGQISDHRSRRSPCRCER